MKPPSVSVAIATYRRAPMVRQAIEAAFAQTLPPNEICVTDDASPDNTWAVLTSLAQSEPRLRPILQEKNTGGVENWNRAVEETRGDYIAWCSDDDRYLPDHLERCVAYLQQHPEVGLVHAGFVDAVETGGGGTAVFERIPRPLRFHHDTILRREDLLAYLILHYDWPFHPSTMVWRRKVWERVGRFNSQYALADTDWFLRVAEEFPVAMLAHHGVLNRRHPGNWSNRLGSVKMQAEIRTIVERCIDRLFPGDPLHRFFWKQVWRANVRLRLLLTLQARIRSGHAEAACAAWRHLFPAASDGNPWISSGEKLVARWAQRRPARFQDARQSVSPL